MSERPEGDRIDQFLRQGITALVESGEPANDDVPNLDEIRRQSNRRRTLGNSGFGRGTFLATAACIVFAVLGAVRLADGETTNVEVSGSGGDDAINAAERHDESIDDGAWLSFISQAEPNEQAACLLRWSLNRDQFFRIPADQFAVSMSVSEFTVDARPARAWAERYGSGLRLLSQTVDAETARAIDEVLPSFDAVSAEASSETGEVDVAPAIISTARRFEAIFQPSPDCPLGPAVESRSTHVALVRYSASDAAPMASAVDCVDAELARIAPDTKLSSTNLNAYLAAGGHADSDAFDLWRSNNLLCPVAGPSWE